MINLKLKIIDRFKKKFKLMIFGHNLQSSINNHDSVLLAKILIFQMKNSTSKKNIQNTLTKLNQILDI